MVQDKKEFNIYKVGDRVYAITRPSSNFLLGIDISENPNIAYGVEISRSSHYDDNYGDIVDLVSWTHFYKTYIKKVEFGPEDLAVLSQAILVVKNKFIDYEDYHFVNENDNE